jgi:hypothetical protein
MFKVKYDDTKRRCKRKLKQKKNEALTVALAKKLLNRAHRGVEALVEI